MAKLTWTKRSFASGALSQHICQSRTDLPLYAQCFSESVNVIPLKTGALIHRPNTLSFPKVVLPFGASRLIPFYIADDTHVLLGEEKLTFILVEGSGHPKVIETVSTVYDRFDSSQLDYAIFGNLMVLVHCDHPPYQIKVIDKENYEFSKMKFSSPPWLGGRIIGGVKSDAKLTIHVETTEFSDIKILSYKGVASSSVFKTEDIGRFLRIGLLPSSWAPRTQYEENSYVCMQGKVYQSVSAGKSGAEWVENQKDTFIKDSGVLWKTLYSSQTLPSNSASDGSKPGVKGLSGVVPPYYVYGQITSFYNDREVGIDLTPPRTISQDQSTYEWNFSAWDPSVYGYPSHVTFYQNRLVFSGARNDASSFYLSEYEDFNSFSPDGDYGIVDYLKALSSEVTDDAVREIRWIVPMGDGLLIGCDSSLWFFCIELERGVNLFMRKLSGSGVYSCPPVVVGDSILYVCGAGRCIKAVSGSFEQGFKFKDLTQFVDHLFTYRIKQLVYQGEPYSLIWGIDRSDLISEEDVSLFGCRFTPEEDNDFAWHIHRFDRSGIIALTTFPSVDRGQTDLWLLVSRAGKKNTSQVSLERLERFNSAHNHYTDGDVTAREDFV